MFIVKNKKIFVIISAVLIILSIFSISYFGINFGIDFRGGSLLEIKYEGIRPDQKSVEESIKSLSLGGAIIQPMGGDGYSIKMKDLTDGEKNLILESLGKDALEESFTSIGPSVGNELVRKSIISFILVALGIIFWIAFSFRQVSKQVSSWKYGVIAIIALIHDTIIPTGILAFLGYLNGFEVDTLFVVAILTILGLSVSDTIVVFDRIRENIRIGHFKTFEETVGNSLKQVYKRSLATSFTVIVALLALVFFGPESTRMFSIILAIGMFFGTYSSLFLASPLLVMWNNFQNKNNK
ncbi:TPA: protein translocase subunit SecF [Candidatus Nomurabacteria bacterium]|nr:MAG: Protein-export membrane protein SecF [Parcubacteria bacterium RAAC4_OD1_1]HCY26534.1 protein translocase subunit SecF [Candidatus Nomurabacteria bacterium]